jgi:hypothetical protein
MIHTAWVREFRITQIRERKHRRGRQIGPGYAQSPITRGAPGLDFSDGGGKYKGTAVPESVSLTRPGRGFGYEATGLKTPNDYIWLTICGLIDFPTIS